MPIIKETDQESSSVFPAFIHVPTGALAGKRLGLRIENCDNPLCKCTDLQVALVDEEDQRVYVKLALDVAAKTKSANSPTPGGKDHALIETVLQSLDKKDWQYLWDNFQEAMAKTMESADPAQLDADFPMANDIEQHGELVPFTAIYPHASTYFLEFQDEMVILDEQYCLRRGCDCDRIAIGFLAIENMKDKARQKPGESHVLFLTYRTGKVVDSDPGDSTSQSPTELWNAFQAKYPNLLSVFSKRHKQLNILYEGYWKRRKPITQALGTGKIGRNEPCPCGSRKKFKRCCAQAGDHPSPMPLDFQMLRSAGPADSAFPLSSKSPRS